MEKDLTVVVTPYQAARLKDLIVQRMSRRPAGCLACTSQPCGMHAQEFAELQKVWEQLP